MSDTIVTTQWLADHLDDPHVKVIEVSADPELAAFRDAHVPGAAGQFWKALCWHDSDREFVTPEKLAERLGALGIGDGATLVLYGDPVQYGTYAFWALIMAGHKDLRIMDGGRRKWLAEERPTEKGMPAFEAVEYRPQAGDSSMRVGRANVRDNLGKPGRFLLDVRTPEEYSGERVMEYGQFDHGAERNGRIPGAKHLFFRELLNEDDTFKSADELRAILIGAGADPDRNDEIVVYCRLSHRATLAWTAMTRVLDFDNVKIYDGSWTEWGSIVGYPVEA
jgi:thiosulfate/3-mercaptopyruvate sulfurtransferase